MVVALALHAADPDRERIAVGDRGVDNQQSR
jgi:hypothetical protein